ncbi:hypothetical protein DERP_012606 [Dermatophagoides pteronyssinus]|uniref:Uncharacterized protein n=1 Tax=Dermatophagoides pteronyssinus TaxID=6956 RepID=A0ABQ8IUZ1_DERPT|nr:hypothetical protein DERP_012606 [Dermatophagoides pteronyssinus]
MSAKEVRQRQQQMRMTTTISYYLRQSLIQSSLLCLICEYYHRSFIYYFILNFLHYIIDRFIAL